MPAEQIKLLHSGRRNDKITLCCLKYRLKEIMQKEEHKTALKIDKNRRKKKWSFGLRNSRMKM
jgi:hypothetical protein